MPNTPTSNHGFNKPATADVGWGATINAVLDQLDQLFITTAFSAMEAAGPLDQLVAAGVLDFKVVSAARTLKKVAVSCMTTPAAGTITFDVLKNGVSIYPGAKPTLACDGTIKGSVSAAPANVNLVANDVVTFVLISTPAGETDTVIVKVELY